MRQRLIAAAAALLLAASASATPTSPANNAEYRTLAQPQAVQPAGQKVEVIEFFMYHCPACYTIEAPLAEWAKKNSDKVNFRRIHLSGGDDAEAHLFVTLEALQLHDALHDKVIHAWHVERRRLRSDADNLEWAVQNGIDRQKFLDAYNSFGVTARLRNLARVAANYQVDGTPTLIVDGKYQTSPTMVNIANPQMSRPEVIEATLQVIDALVARARK